MKHVQLLALAAFTATTALSAQPALAGATLDAIKQRDALRCSVQGPSNPGFGVPDSAGNWQGFNVDLCRAVAVAILGDPAKIEIAALTTQTRFPALQSGEVDLATNNTTYVQLRETQLKFDFPAITFYDGQGVMVPMSSGITQVTELDGATICVQPGTTTELNLNDYFRNHNLEYTPLVIESREELTRQYGEGRCDALTADATILAAQRTTLQNPGEHVILEERLSKEPLGLAIRRGDDDLRVIVTWAFNVLVNAEELGITQANVDEMLDSTNPEICRFLGVEGDLGNSMGVDNKYAYNIVKALGNYGELYEKYLGESTPLGIERGMNNLWSNGGILYVPPAR